jgi:RHS repeat-associated protein
LSSGAAELYADGAWARAGATPTNGQSSYTATAQDTYGRTSQDTASVNLPATNTFSYDSNGNLLNDGQRYFEYDWENRLTNVYVSGQWRSEFAYDGLMRRRVRKEYKWSGSAWLKTNEMRYVYDGLLVIQERDVYNLPLVSYTRGNDLSGELQGAGGIGGLLARTDPSTLNSQLSTAYYHCDGNGNVTALVNSNQVLLAHYGYDPYGNTLAASGPLAQANLYRFSSKEYHPNSGTVYYLYRFYDPNLQRWLNRDPIRERGGLNLYSILGNTPVSMVDPLGLTDWCEVRRGALTTVSGIIGIIGGALLSETVVGIGGIVAGVPAVGLGITSVAHGFMDNGPVNTPTGTVPGGTFELIGAMTGNPDSQRNGARGDLGVAWLTPPAASGPLATANWFLDLIPPAQRAPSDYAMPYEPSLVLQCNH